MESNLILKKQLAIKYAGSMQHYEHFKRLMGASGTLYPHDYHFYNDDVVARHNRNIKEITLLKTLLKEGKIEPPMLSFNVFNTYYPSYVLHHHYDVFIPALAQFASQKEVKELLSKANQNVATGAYFHDKIRLDFKRTDKELPSINEAGVVQMNAETYFYSGATSPYITHCAFLAQDGKGLKLALVQLRDNEGSFVSTIKLRDMGATVSDDYLPIGYNFSGVKPLLIIERKFAFI